MRLLICLWNDDRGCDDGWSEHPLLIAGAVVIVYGAISYLGVVSAVALLGSLVAGSVALATAVAAWRRSRRR